MREQRIFQAFCADRSRITGSGLGGAKSRLRENFWGYTDCSFTPCDPAFWTPPPYAKKQTLEMKAYPQTIQNVLGKQELTAYHESVQASVATVYSSACSTDQNWTVTDN